MRAMKRVVAAATLALGVLALVPTEALAQNCYWNTSSSLASGYTPTEYSRDNGVSWHPAYSVSPEFTYAVLPGTSYINYNPTTSGTDQSWTKYRTSFYVAPPPSGTRVFQRHLTLEVHADNVAWAYLDGSLFFQQSWTDNESNFQGAPEGTSLSIGTGHHTLSFELFNFAGPTALDYRVTVEEYRCEPCQDPTQRFCEATPL